MNFGTAGHVDHGKTALVRALTGVDTDRLKEEKRRGITLELGFAHVTLPDGTVAGVVDVPGHERFVKAMVAGAGGVDAVIFVVAADEGVKPQTREHLDICRLLGVARGVVAVTKADLLPALPGRMGALRRELAALVKGTFLENATVVPVSTRTGEGMDALKAALAESVKDVTRPADGPLLLPIDRAFTLKGFGTVVTGAVVSGALRVGEEVRLTPSKREGLRVRGLQVHGKPVDAVQSGQRAAVNLADVATTDISRGMALTRAGELPPASMLDVELTVLPSAERALRGGVKLVLHIGAARVPATVGLLGRKTVAPGESVVAQARLGRPVAAAPGQRFVLRGDRARTDRGATLAGGRVLRIATKKRRGADLPELEALRRGETLTAPPVAPSPPPPALGRSPEEDALRQAVADALRSARLAPPRVVTLAQQFRKTEGQIRSALTALVREGAVVRGDDELFFDRPAVAELQERLVAHLRKHGEISTPVFKGMVGQSRKYVIPLSEHFDRERVTLRVGEKRKLRRG